MSTVGGVGAVAIETVTGETIDNTWVEIQGLRSSLNIAVNTLEDRIDSLEGAVTLISDNVSKIEAAASDIDVETPILLVEQKLESLQGSLAATSVYGTDISLLGNRVKSLESFAADNRWVTIQSAAAKVSSVENTIGELRGSLNTAINERGSLRSDISGLASKISSIESVLATISVSEESEVTIVPYDDTDIKNSVSGLTDEISLLGGDIQGLETVTTSLWNSVNSLNSAVTIFPGQISSLNSDISGIKSSLGNYRTSMTAIESRVSSVEGVAGAVPTRTNLSVISLLQGSGGNTLQEATGRGSTPIKFTMDYGGKNFSFLGNWINDGGTGGSGIFTADDGAGDIRVYLVKKDGAALKLEKIFPFEGDLGDLDPEQVQVVKVFFKTMLENERQLNSEEVIDLAISACTKNTSWGVKTWQGLVNAMNTDIGKYISEGKNYAAILPELCGINYTNADVGAIGGIDTGGKETLDKYTVVEEDPDEPDYQEYEVPLALYNGLGRYVETVNYRGRYLDGIYWVHPPFTDTLNSSLVPPNGGVISSSGSYTMPEANRKFYRKFLRYQLPAILRRIKEGYGMSWEELTRGPNYIVTANKSGVICRSLCGNNRVVPILISNEPRAKGISANTDQTNILARTISYSLNQGTGCSGEAVVIEIPVANIAYTAARDDDLDGLREATATSKFLDRTLCHEMVHAMMFSNIKWLGIATGNSNLERSGISALKSVAFTEGIAELICGADDTRLFNLAAVVDRNFSQQYYGFMNSLEDYLRQKLTGMGKTFQYAAGYCALRYFLKQCVAHKKGGS